MLLLRLLYLNIKACMRNGQKFLLVWDTPTTGEIVLVGSGVGTFVGMGHTPPLRSNDPGGYNVPTFEIDGATILGNEAWYAPLEVAAASLGLKQKMAAGLVKSLSVAKVRETNAAMPAIQQNSRVKNAESLSDYMRGATAYLFAFVGSYDHMPMDLVNFHSLGKPVSQ
jgi:hypothetical protein